MATTYPAFNVETTGAEVVDAFADRVKGKIFLITGASPSSIGSSTALALARASPATFVLAGRTPSKLTTVIDQIAAVNPNIKTVLIKLDLASLASVRVAANEILASADMPHVDVLINNAGVMACPFSLTEDGFENHFASNHLGHFLFTSLLAPKLRGARIVNVTSSGHRLGDGDYSDHAFTKRPYEKWSAYGQSKLAQVYFTKGLAERGISAYTLHPGWIEGSNLGQHTKEEDFVTLMKMIDATPNFEAPIRKTLEQGCATTLVAALDPAIPSGSYLGNCQVQEPSVAALDAGKSVALWELSENLVGERFTV